MLKSIEDMIGKTPIKISGSGDEILFEFDDGSTVLFYHSQGCCESVTVEDVNGDWSDLLFTPILEARESQEGGNNGAWGDSYTWTFYTYRSIKGSVDVRWYGTSNGYYSESVDIKWSQPKLKRMSYQDMM
jgi:hypothetical protein